MKKYEDFKSLFMEIRQMKIYVVKLRGNDLHKFREMFYDLPFPEWRLDLLWEYIWDDKTYDEIYYIFKNSKLI